MHGGETVMPGVVYSIVKVPRSLRAKWVRTSAVCWVAPQGGEGFSHFARTVYFVPAWASSRSVTAVTVFHVPLECRSMTTVTLASRCRVVQRNHVVDTTYVF
jgi:hypothetical protein